ncbi:MAG: hypothetical protein LBQ40_01385 [Clostridiales bacterium]|nr:hypothetical protein [Clostridiales bacterium]
MKKIVYSLMFLTVFGMTYLVLPYFRASENPKLRYVYANTISVKSVQIPDGDASYTDGSGDGAVVYRVIRGIGDLIPEVKDNKVTGYTFGDENYILAADLNLGGLPLYFSSEYTKIFNGNEYSIKNAKIENGIFGGKLGKTAVVKGLTIDSSCAVTGASIAKINEGSIIDVKNHAAVTGKIISYTSKITGKLTSAWTGGGIVFENYGLIKDVINGADVKANGGIAQINGKGGRIVCSYNVGRISGEGDYMGVGGIAGENYGEISDTYNGGYVDGKAQTAGGIAGESRGVITNCENNANVVATGLAGGIAGGFRGRINGSANFGLVKATAGSGVAGGIAGKTLKAEDDDDKAKPSISGSKNLAVVIGNTSRGIIGEGDATVTDTKNFGRLNGKTEFTVKLDEFLAETKLIIVAIIGLLIVTAIGLMIRDRYRLIKNRRTEIENILYYSGN